MRESATGPVTWATLILAVAVALSTGWFGGTAVWSDASFRSIATLLSPSTLASWIWVLILLGIGVHTIWLWTGRGRASKRARSAVWPLVAVILCDAAWLLLSAIGWVWPSVIALIALFIALLVLNRTLDRTPPRDTAERLLLDGTFGLHLGWTTLAMMAAIAQAAVHAGTEPRGVGHTVLAIAVLALVVLMARLIIPRIRFFESVLIGHLWGLVWLGVTRWTTEPRSVPVAIAALAAAAAVIVLWAVRDRDVPPAPHPR